MLAVTFYLFIIASQIHKVRATVSQFFRDGYLHTTPTTVKNHDGTVIMDFSIRITTKLNDLPLLSFKRPKFLSHTTLSANYPVIYMEVQIRSFQCPKRLRARSEQRDVTREFGKSYQNFSPFHSTFSSPTTEVTFPW